MTLSRLLLLPACLTALLFASCATDGRSDGAAFLKSVLTLRVDPVADNHAFCNDGGSVGPGNTFATIDECLSARKYRLKWDRPEDTSGFTEYRIYVDTTPPNASGASWRSVQKDRSLATFVMAGSGSASDSLIFVLGASNASPQIVSRTGPRIVRLDTTGRLDSTGNLVFAITTAYGGGSLGQPIYTRMVTNDRFAPDPVRPVFKPLDRSVEVTWSRPGDPTSFFDPEADSGIIRGYKLRVVRVSTAKNPVPFTPVLSLYTVNGVNRTIEVKVDSFRTTKGYAGRVFWLPDSQRVFARLKEDARDSLKAIVSGMTPLDTLDLRLWAVDVSGNATDSNTSNTTFLTDTTQPTTPVLQLVAGSVTRNGFVYTFTASRDRIESGGVLVPAATPNANIQQYMISRRRTTGSFPVVDSIFKVPAALRNRELFTDTVRYLPPGVGYTISVYAVDSTGHTSDVGTLSVTTPAAAFTGADSGATCPTGFTAIPGGRFQLGSTSSGVTDETPPRSSNYLKPYCIESYEHRDAATNVFTTKVTWEQARDVCAAVSPSNNSHLCTEAEWERACEGIETTPLTYGIQSEARAPQNVRYACNIGTNDSAMANSLALRDPTCLSYEGVFDMSGNFAEWVLDPYTNTYPAVSDTLLPGQPHTTPTDASRRGYRGTHYLNTSQTPAVMQSAGRCSNRTEARQLRPKAYTGCTDATGPRLVVTYPSNKAPRCFVLPDTLLGRTISSVLPGRDTNAILILLPGQTTPVTYTMPVDTAYRLLKPSGAALTTLALAVVTFVNSETEESIVDTLDAKEMLGASSAGLDAIFAREASPPWAVKRVNGQPQIRYLYSYAMSLSVQTRKYYSNQLIGFRCCSNPVPATLGKRRALPKR